MKPFDPDIKALRGAIRALSYSSSPRMLRANLEFLWDRFVNHPSQTALAGWKGGAGR